MFMTPDSVLLVTPLWGRSGGVAAHVTASATLLARHGLDVRVLTARVESGEDLQGVTVYHRPELFNARASIDAMFGQSRSFRPAVIHLHQVDDPGIVRRMQRCAPVVMSAHGYTACTSGVYYFRPGQECTRSHGLGCLPNLAARGCAHTRYPKTLPLKYLNATRGVQALKRADLAISYSSAVDRHLAANGVMRRQVIPLFTTTVPKIGSGHASRRRVVFAGRIVPPKGVGVLLRAAASVDAEFVICGTGRRLEEMRALAQRLGVGQRVHFPGWLSAGELAEELANASVVVLPSLWPEPFGLVGIEALAAGRPVIASSTGGIVDWLQDGVSGMLVDPGDAAGLAKALNELLADPERQQRMGLAGKRAVDARFSPERHVDALLEAYRVAHETWQSNRSQRS
jgi:glycosyltransferase involved in cell wall biosynthesis